MRAAALLRWENPMQGPRRLLEATPVHADQSRVLDIRDVLRRFSRPEKSRETGADISDCGCRIDRCRSGEGNGVRIVKGTSRPGSPALWVFAGE